MSLSPMGTRISKELEALGVDLSPEHPPSSRRLVARQEDQARALLMVQIAPPQAVLAGSLHAFTSPFLRVQSKPGDNVTWQDLEPETQITPRTGEDGGVEQALLTTRLASLTPTPPSLCKASVAAETSVFLTESPVCQDIPVCVILAAESHWISPAQDANILPGKGIRQQRGERNPLQDRYRQPGSCGCPQTWFKNTPCPQHQQAGTEIQAIPQDHF